MRELELASIGASIATDDISPFSKDKQDTGLLRESPDVANFVTILDKFCDLTSNASKRRMPGSFDKKTRLLLSLSVVPSLVLGDNSGLFASFLLLLFKLLICKLLCKILEEFLRRFAFYLPLIFKKRHFT